MSDISGPLPPLVIPVGQTSAPFSAQILDGTHARGEDPKCRVCEEMRKPDQPRRYPGAWPDDFEPFGHASGSGTAEETAS